MSTKAYYTHEEIGKGKPGFSKTRSIIEDEINAMLENVDLIVGPTVPKLPHKIGDELTPMEMYAYDVLTVIANLA